MATPAFILRLREGVGHELLWLTGVTAVILRSDGATEQVLLVRRSDNGRWTPVTGVMDPGDTVAGTAIREAMEETGVVIEVQRLAWVHTLPPQEYPNGDRSQYVDHVVRARYVSGDAHVADDESTEVGWFGLDALPPMQQTHLDRIAAALPVDGPCRLD
ncbi:NUDIX domain-containing protein [Microbacteriaceae bacterium VKM Ac-2855]|nr:NUDIX domain-containing protein [Microbacteriaceae bacterium VKM Ac-2855]